MQDAAVVEYLALSRAQADPQLHRLARRDREQPAERPVERHLRLRLDVDRAEQGRMQP